MVNFGQALKNAIDNRGVTQIDASKVAMVDNSTLGKYIKGTRNAPIDVMQRTTEHFNDPFLSMAAANEVSGNSFVPILDNVDLHRCSVHLKTVEEIDEARAALSVAPITKRHDQLTEADLQAIQAAINESMGAITALMHYLAVLCKEYCISWVSIWKSHRKMLKDKNYIK